MPERGGNLFLPGYRNTDTQPDRGRKRERESVGKRLTSSLSVWSLTWACQNFLPGSFPEMIVKSMQHISSFLHPKPPTPLPFLRASCKIIPPPNYSLMITILTLKYRTCQQLHIKCDLPMIKFTLCFQTLLPVNALRGHY